jgi:hypothetical protein
VVLKHLIQLIQRGAQPLTSCAALSIGTKEYLDLVALSFRYPVEWLLPVAVSEAAGLIPAFCSPA